MVDISFYFYFFFGVWRGLSWLLAVGTAIFIMHLLITLQEVTPLLNILVRRLYMLLCFTDRVTYEYVYIRVSLKAFQYLL